MVGEMKDIKHEDSEEAKSASSHGSGARCIHERNIAPFDTAAATPRPAGSIYMGNFCAPKLDCIRIAIIGLGARGQAHAQYLSQLPGCRIIALCDGRRHAVHQVAKILVEASGHAPALYSDSESSYLEMLENEHPDAVFIDTPWELHARMAIDSMRSGAHAFVEVPLALTLDDLWAVVDTAERTQKHCMMLEEVTYGRNELMFLHMVRLGLIGDLLHGEAAYIHDLRERTMGGAPGEVSWRACHYADRNGNLYPTHGLAPVAQYMNIARGEDTFDRIISLSSPSLGRSAFVKKDLASRSPWNHTNFLCGDINTSIIQTKLGRTILVQWDESSPRPYDRKNLIQGTEGTLADFPLRVTGSFTSSTQTLPAPDTAGAVEHTWYTGAEASEDLHSRFEHPLYRRLANHTKLLTPRAAMDYLMLYRIIECLQQGLPTDQNVYEAALWSAVGPLSEKSVHEGGAPQIFPDFTRGDWKHTRPSL